MKKIIILLSILVLLLCGCTQAKTSETTQEKSLFTTSKNENSSHLDNAEKPEQNEEKNLFTRAENGNIISPSGIEYSHLANEGFLYYFGELEFIGSIQGEKKTSQHLGVSYQTGMFDIIDDNSDNILIRLSPDSEWYSIYRKSNLPAFDFSADNCIRLELIVQNYGGNVSKTDHTTCNGGISDKTEIAEFLSEIRAQETPNEAGLYELVTKPDGMLENCYHYGKIYGFFEDEPNLAIPMSITSFNDLAYSISIGHDEYVLPESWLLKLQTSSCTP